MLDDLIIALLDPICTPFMWLLRFESVFAISLMGIVGLLVWAHWKGDEGEDVTK